MILKFNSIFSTKTLILFALINLMLILLLCVNTFYWADDYCFILDLNKNGVVNNCIQGYYNWDGRFLTIAGFFQGFCLKYLKIEFITFIWSLFFLSASGLFFFILKEEFNFKFKSKSYCFLIFLFVIVSFWLANYSHFSETIYWGTGGCYSFDLFFGALWIFFFLKIQKNTLGFSLKILFLIFTILVAALTQNLSIALLGLVFIYLIINKFYNLNLINNFNFLIFIFLILGTLHLSLAPGNFIRLNAANSLKIYDLNIFILILNYCKILYHYLLFSWLSILLSIFLAIVVFFSSHNKFQFIGFNFYKFPTNKDQFVAFLLEFKWLIIALTTILPFVLIVNLAAPRTVIFFVFFISLQVFSSTFGVLIKSFKVTENQNYNIKNWINLSIFFNLILVFLFVIFNLYKGFYLKQAITNRENLLKAAYGKSVSIHRINLDLKSQCFRFTDFLIDIPLEDDFVLRSHQEFYNVKITVLNNHEIK